MLSLSETDSVDRKLSGLLSRLSFASGSISSVVNELHTMLFLYSIRWSLVGRLAPYLQDRSRYGQANCATKISYEANGNLVS